MRVPANRIASALFLCSAVGPLGVWFILLFVATPLHQSALQSATEMATFALSESEAPWFFALLAALPFVFGFLATAAWRVRASARQFTSWLTILAVAGIALGIAVIWEVTPFAAMATYLLVSQRDA